MHAKRYLFIIPVILLCLFAVRELRENAIYETITAATAVYIFFLNFPYFTRIFHLTPIYYEDLEDKEQRDRIERKRYQLYFLHFMNIILSLTIAGVAYYIRFQFHNTTLGTMEIIMLFGGLGQIYTVIQTVSGHVILSLLHSSKERRRRRNSDIEMDELENGVKVINKTTEFGKTNKFKKNIKKAQSKFVSLVDEQKTPQRPAMSPRDDYFTK